MTNWHSLKEEEVFKTLSSSPSGISEEEAKARLQTFGKNELKEKERVPIWLRFLDQFKSPLIFILLAAILVSGILGEYIDAIVISAIVLMNAILGLIQEERAEKALQALKKMAVPKAQVIREGKIKEIDSTEVVPGDVIVLSAGNRVPADARVISSFNLMTDEAPLTGESVPVEKSVGVLEEETSLGEQRNMVFSGTTVTYGRGEAVVVSTGMSTEIGKIATLLEETEKEATPLQRNLDQVGKVLALMVLGICLVVFLVGILRGAPILFMLLLSISLAVAAIPEGLPAVVTIVLALGTQRMAQRGAIIRHLPAVETLGSTSIICSDKTGTMTLNEMTVEFLVTAKDEFKITGKGYEPKGEIQAEDGPLSDLPPDIEKLVVAASLNTDAHLVKEGERWEIRGDPTEGALVVLSHKLGFKKEDLLKEYQRIHEIPFTSERKMMTTVFRKDGAHFAFSKGAPDVLIHFCNRIQNGEEVEPLSERGKDLILKKNERMARDGLRVLGIAYKPLKENEAPEKDLIFLGLVGMRDAAREEVKEAIEICRKAGIKPVMITGDHLLTAVAIGSQLGLIEKEHQAITGEDLSRLSPEELLKKAPELSIYARVSPEDKVRILNAYQSLGHVVAMTGDGINDAPALKQANIGVAMGITGTDVSKEAADMVLTDDNFATIVKAVEEGRTIFSNIKKFISFLLSCNLAEVLAVFMGFLLFPAREPILTPAQILWMNLVTDGLPALALGVNPPEKGVMEEKPRSKKTGIFTKRVLWRLGISALLMAVSTLFAFVFGLKHSVVKGETMAFTTIVVLELLYSFYSRSDRLPGWKMGFGSNKYLIWAVISSFLLQVLIVYTPGISRAFGTLPLDLIDWGFIALLGIVNFGLLEALKVLVFSKIPE
ncbi:MAG: calcium-translocating P-type ATPase, SERCA-type [Caldiserica bacterium]|jgi:Ca2+-transporting ATPase|nr:calcium-translocating P-type ATPase, SERCA-type [Caldisericota bacterium]MDH7563036.1 calcium-translocating P-type ATPase, SERCA-type [Caldisericota bacterium]